MIPEYLILDIENNSTPESKKYGRLAGTPLLGNELVAIGLKNQKELSSKYIFPDVLKEFYIDEEVLVIHNAGHDLMWFWYLDTFQDWLKQGGRLFDTALAEYILTGQGNKYPALRPLAIQYGRPKREKLMEPYWEKGILTSDIPRALVLQDVEQDVVDTEAVYLKQYEQLLKRPKMMKLVELQNDALLATIECTMNGLYIDQEILRKNKQDLELKLQQKEKELMQLVNEVWK